MDQAQKRRLFLQQMLQKVLGTEDLSGSASRVYYQPPETIKLVYPCIIYERSNIQLTHADDRNKYRRFRKYDITLIDRDPDSKYIDRILDLPYCAFNRHFVNDNLNHDVFSIYI